MNPQQPDTTASLRDEARELLRRLTGAPEADFHDGQHSSSPRCCRSCATRWPPPPARGCALPW